MLCQRYRINVDYRVFGFGPQASLVTSCFQNLQHVTGRRSFEQHFRPVHVPYPFDYARVRTQHVAARQFARSYCISEPGYQCFSFIVDFPFSWSAENKAGYPGIWW